jgi:hypothetical protein
VEGLARHTKKEADEFYSFRLKAENVSKVFTENKALHTQGGSSMLEWLAALHKTFCLTSIRRELEGGPHENLVSFLYEIEKFSERVFTRKRFVAMYGERLAQFGIPDKQFDGIPGTTCKYPRTSPDEDFISIYSVKRARESLRKFAEPVLAYMNWQVAHRTPAKAPSLTLGDIYRTMNRISTHTRGSTLC